MPTARELLEQADALMRRNRSPLAAADDIPELTDEVPLAADDIVVAARASAANDAVATAAARDDVPELTDAVAYVDAVSIEAVPDDEVTRWLESELGAQSVLGDGPDSIALVPPAPQPLFAPTHDEPGLPDAADSPASSDAPAATTPETPAPPPQSAAAALAAFSSAAPAPSATPPESDYAFEAIERAPAAPSEPPSIETLFDEKFAGTSVAAAEDTAEAPAEPTAAAERPVVADDPARWSALAEEIRMQVLQRIDIFTDTGLQQQLTARLQPIVDRASADLVAAINQHVGTLLRAYVAEAIEREIEKWRQGSR